MCTLQEQGVVQAFSSDAFKLDAIGRTYGFVRDPSEIKRGFALHFVL